MDSLFLLLREDLLFGVYLTKWVDWELLAESDGELGTGPDGGLASALNPLTDLNERALLGRFSSKFPR